MLYETLLHLLTTGEDRLDKVAVTDALHILVEAGHVHKTDEACTSLVFEHDVE